MLTGLLLVNDELVRASEEVRQAPFMERALDHRLSQNQALLFGESAISSHRLGPLALTQKRPYFRALVVSQRY